MEIRNFQLNDIPDIIPILGERDDTLPINSLSLSTIRLVAVIAGKIVGAAFADSEPVFFVDPNYELLGVRTKLAESVKREFDRRRSHSMAS